MRRLAMYVTLLVLIVAVVFAGSTTAEATTKKPAVTKFKVTPSTLYKTGGQITLTASVTNAKSCKLSSMPTIAGLPSTIKCSNGPISKKLTVPANKTARTEVYKFTISVSGPPLASASADLTVTTHSPPPTVSGFKASPSMLPYSGGSVTLSANVTNAKVCTFVSSVEITDFPWIVACSQGRVSRAVTIPENMTSAARTYTFSLFVMGTTTVAAPPVTVSEATSAPLSGAKSITSDGDGYCAVLASNEVDCWGRGTDGQLGNGAFYTSGNEGSATPVEVKGVAGSGLLSGVASLASDSGGAVIGADTYCALLISTQVDCWGYGGDGELGNGTFYPNFNDSGGSATPVQVKGVGGSGLLSGVASLVSDGHGYCALLTSGEVDCWGYGVDGELGNGTFYANSNNYGSAIPVQVRGVGGSGLLSGVASLTSLSYFFYYGAVGDASYCALLTSGGVDCWGYGVDGELGNGTFYTSGNYGSASPVQVAGVGGSGLLTGVASLTSGALGSYCALLTSGGVDCWGYGVDGELGNGTFYTSGNGGSATPVQVVGVGGSGLLAGVASLASGADIATGPDFPDTGDSFCALLTSGGVDCWGVGYYGQLGNGTFYTSGNYGSASPVQVVGVGGSGLLTDVGRLVGGSQLDASGYCAVLTSAEVDCWGNGSNGQLGNGTFYTSGNYGSAAPVQVEGVGGSSLLSGVADLTNESLYGDYCAVVTSSDVDCWGSGGVGELGNGTFYAAPNYGSAAPVQVESPA